MIDELKKYFITTEHPYKEGSVEVFKQNIIESNISKATLYITSLGVYEASMNNKKIGNQYLAPGYTYYPKDLHVQKYDVKDMLNEKENILIVYLGQGWYSGRFTCDNKTQIYGDKPAVSWILEIVLNDGNVKKYTSLDSDVESIVSPYDYAGLYDGEIYFADGSKRDVLPEIYKPIPFEGKLPDVLEECDEQVRVREEITVKNIINHDDYTIIDFGQNFAGIVEIDPTKMNGEVINLRHGEILNEDGSLYTANLRKAKAEIIYHKGTDTNLYRPRFTYMGFRYVELRGCEYKEGLLKAHAIYSDMDRTGYFKCDNHDVNRLYENQIWGQKSNYIEVPTDCPQRDERMGYTGDGHVFALTGAYNFDTENFWNKFLKDIRYSQLDNKEGYVAPYVPALGEAGIGFINMLGWGNADTIIPEMLYKQFGDDKPLKNQYESMKTFVECEIRHFGGLMGKKDLWIGPNLGDWLTLGKDVKYMAMHNGPVSNSFIVNDLRIMTWASEYLDKQDDHKRYSEQLKKTRNAYIKAFVKTDGTMKDDYQGAYIMALKHVIPEGDLWNKVFEKLLSKIKEEGMQTGFFATEHLLAMLVNHGQGKLAYDLLLQPNCPGWMYQVNQGATTIWERWDALRPDGTVNESKMSNDNMVSFNHYSFGSVGEFYYQNILGIQPLKPGYSEIKLCPTFDERLGNVSGSYNSRAGQIKVSWTIDNDNVNLVVDVPTKTELHLPNNDIQTLLPGHHEIKTQLCC